MVNDTSSPIAQLHDEMGDGDAGKMLAEALASLQLPQMPDADEDELADRVVPSVTILVCADIDLASTSALAEYLLMDHPHSSNVDLIIAAGPCTRDEDLSSYCQGSAQRSKYKRRRQQLPAATNTFSHHPAAATTAQQNSHHDYSAEQHTRGGDLRTDLSPFYRSCEESAAMEGLLTSALSQLESIVCRVLYCPGFSDPFSVIMNADSKRLTPNSRILHRQWLPLVSGLGCAGVFYVDGVERVANTVASSYHADDSDASDDEESEINSAMLLTEQVKKMQQRWVVLLQVKICFY